MRVATIPMNKAAVQQANTASAAKFNPQPQPGDPNYGAFRSQWMDSYAAAGGTVKEMDAKGQLHDIQQTRARSASMTGERGAVVSCPYKAPPPVPPKPGAVISAKPPPLPPRPPPKPAPAPPSQPAKDCTCKLTGLDVTCSHGRAAKNQLLMVVSDHALGDQITVAAKGDGDCASRMETRADSKEGFPFKGPGTKTFRASELPLNIAPGGWSGGVLTMRNAQPLTTFVTSSADGASKLVKVVAYPSKKLSFSIDAAGVVKDFKGILAYLPINMGGKRKPIRKLDDDDDDDDKGIGVSIKFESGWAEDDGHLAYCEMELGGEAELLSAEAAVPIFGVPVPPLLSKYVKAGIYLNLSAGVSASISASWQYWPEPGQTKWADMKAGGSGSVKIELAAELLLLSPDVVQVKAAGWTDASISVWGEKENGERPAIAAKAEFNPLTVGCTFKLAWGLFEVERSWPVFKTIETPDLKHVF